MSIDGYYSRVKDKWLRQEIPVVNGEYIADERPEFQTDFWVDVFWNAPFVIDERYYFPDLASALAFYEGGWKKRQFLCDDETPCGIDHRALYSQGQLVHYSANGDAPPGTIRLVLHEETT